jgi:hypothetical protein
MARLNPCVLTFLIRNSSLLNSKMSSINTPNFGTLKTALVKTALWHHLQALERLNQLLLVQESN